MKKLFIFALLSVVLTACVGPMTPIRDASDEQSSLVYGYFTGDLGVPNITLYNKKTKVMAPWVKGNVPAHTFSNGLIVFDNVQPGEYWIHGFGVGQTSYSLGEHRIEVKVGAGEVIFLGAYRYAHNPGLLSREFTLYRVDEPSHRTVLEWAVEATADTDWSPRLQQRLKTL